MRHRHTSTRAHVSTQARSHNTHAHALTHARAHTHTRAYRPRTRHAGGTAQGRADPAQVRRPTGRQGQPHACALGDRLGGGGVQWWQYGLGGRSAPTGTRPPAPCPVAAMLPYVAACCNGVPRCNTPRHAALRCRRPCCAATPPAATAGRAFSSSVRRASSCACRLRAGASRCVRVCAAPVRVHASERECVRAGAEACADTCVCA